MTTEKILLICGIVGVIGVVLVFSPLIYILRDMIKTGKRQQKFKAGVILNGYLGRLAREIHANARAKGFFDNGAGLNTGERLALVHSEVSEALEAHRKNHFCGVRNIHSVFDSLNDDQEFKTFFEQRIKNTYEDEMADIVIRVLDDCALKGIDIDGHIFAKMRYNSLREYKHGKSY
jgi:hypothetical protein